jgi:hypothetical protein
MCLRWSRVHSGVLADSLADQLRIHWQFHCHLNGRVFFDVPVVGFLVRWPIRRSRRQEMISVLREVVNEGGDVTDELEHLAVACLSAGVCAANLQDLEAAARLTGEAVEHRRALLGTESESIVYLAEALTNMSHTKCDLGSHDEARELAEEAVTLLSALTDDERISYLTSALVVQAHATNTNDSSGAQLLLNQAMDAAGEDEDLRDEVSEAMAELGFLPEG